MVVLAAGASGSCTGAVDDGGAAARALLERGDTTGAIEFLEHSHLDRSRGPEPFLMIGTLYRSRGTIDGRLRAQRHLERALQLYPRDPRVLMELGRTYYDQTFYPDAERYIRAALALDPSLCDAHHLLGAYYYDKWKRMNDYLDDLDTARVELGLAVECDSSDADAAMRYAYSLYALGRSDSAAAACETALRRFPGRAEFRLLRGALAYDDERFDDAATDFERGLDLMDDETRAAYEDIERFLPVEERSVYAASSPEERATYDRSYWVDVDADPTTARNERRLEHIYRMFLADLFYSCAHPSRRGWETERGETLVKFGWPDKLESSLGGSWKDGRFETWTYEDDGGAVMRFLFVDEFLNGNLRIPYRADLTLAALRDSPRVSDYYPDAVPLPGTMDVVTFKNTEMSSDVCIALSVDADSMSTRADSAGGDVWNLRGVLFDDQWRREFIFGDTLSPSAASTRRRSCEFVRLVTVPFDRYHVACTLDGGWASARFRGEGDSYRYAGDRLTASDILLERPGPSPPVVVRRGRSLYPNAGRRYGPGERLRVYFEVYNLAVSRGASDYSVTFLIYEHPESPPPAWRRWGSRLAGIVGADRTPTISQTFRRSGATHTETEDIAVNIDALDAGRYELVVSIADSLSGESAETSTTFFKKSVAE